METSASVTISPQQKLQNIRVALESVHTSLRGEGRYASASFVCTAINSVAYALEHYQAQTPGHD